MVMLRKARLRKAGTGSSAMLMNLIIAIGAITAGLTVGLLLGQTLFSNTQIGVNAMSQMFGGPATTQSGN